MKHCLAAFTFCLMILNGKSQNSNLDSLYHAVKRYPAADTQRVNLLNALSFELSKNDPQKGMAYADSALALSSQLKNDKKINQSWNNKAVNYTSMGEDSMAMSIYLRLLEFYDKTNEAFSKAIVYHRISILYFNKSDYTTALDFIQKSLEGFIPSGDSVKIAGCYNSMGVNHMRLGNYTEAIDYYLKAKSIFEKINAVEQTAMVLSNIGLVYQRMEEPLKDLEFQQQALAIYQKLNNKQGIVNCLGNLGNTYDNLDSLDRALEYYDRSIRMAKEFNFPRNVASGLTNSSGVFIQQKRYGEAVNALNEAIGFYEQSGDQSAVSVAYGFLANIFIEATEHDLRKAGLNFISRDAESERYYRAALNAAQKANDKTQIYRALHNLSILFTGRNDYKNALAFYRQSVEMRDSIQSDRKKKEIERLQMQAQFDKKEALMSAAHENELALAEAAAIKEKETRKLYAIGALMLLAGSVILFIQYKKRRDIIEKKHDAELQAEITDTEMKALRSQMNPHFIFNALNSINDSILKLDAEKASHFTLRFAKLMRMVLENSEQREISLADDLAALEMYMQVEKIRLNNKFDYSILVDASIDKDALLIPPMLMQPLVENSIWHGVSPKQGRGNIRITIDRVGEMIRCSIEDDGVGRNLSTGKSVNGRQSLGMKITEDRIRLLNRQRSSNASFRLVDIEQGLKAEILLPVINL